MEYCSSPLKKGQIQVKINIVVKILYEFGKCFYSKVGKLYRFVRNHLTTKYYYLLEALSNKILQKVVIIIIFQTNLKWISQNLCKNQTDLSVKLGTTRQNVSDMITGKQMPTVKTLMKIKELFNINIDDLLYKDLSEE